MCLLRCASSRRTWKSTISGSRLSGERAGYLRGPAPTRRKRLLAKASTGPSARSGEIRRRGKEKLFGKRERRESGRIGSAGAARTLHAAAMTHRLITPHLFCACLGRVAHLQVGVAAPCARLQTSPTSCALRVIYATSYCRKMTGFVAACEATIRPASFEVQVVRPFFAWRRLCWWRLQNPRAHGARKRPWKLRSLKTKSSRTRHFPQQLSRTRLSLRQRHPPSFQTDQFLYQLSSKLELRHPHLSLWLCERRPHFCRIGCGSDYNLHWQSCLYSSYSTALLRFTALVRSWEYP